MVAITRARRHVFVTRKRECTTIHDVEHGRSSFFCFRRALRAAGLLRLVALSKRGRVSLARGQLQVHVCTWLHRAELRGRHRRVRQEPVQTRRLQEHSRILQVSRTTALLNGSADCSPTLCISLSRNVLGDDYTTTTTTRTHCTRVSRKPSFHDRNSGTLL